MVLPQKNNPNTSHQHLPSELLQRPPILVSLFIFMWPGVRSLVVISSLGSTSLIWKSFWDSKHFPGSSVGKESTCKAGDPGSIPGSGRSGGEEIGYPLQYSWASLEAQLVKDEKMIENKSLPWKIAPWYVYQMRTVRPILNTFFFFFFFLHTLLFYSNIYPSKYTIQTTYLLIDSPYKNVSFTRAGIFVEFSSLACLYRAYTSGST